MIGTSNRDVVRVPREVAGSGSCRTSPCCPRCNAHAYSLWCSALRHAGAMASPRAPSKFLFASSFLPYVRILRPGQYLSQYLQWCSRCSAEEGSSYDDALILSRASFRFDVLGKIFGIEIVQSEWPARARLWRSLRRGGPSWPEAALTSARAATDSASGLALARPLLASRTAGDPAPQ
jgi:hypothetical protein